MGVRISDPKHVCIYDSVSGTAFGPVFEDTIEAEDFLSWLGNRDARDMKEEKLLGLYGEFVAIREREA